MFRPFDTDARPQTYWPDEPTLEQRIGPIEGLYRRRRAKEMLEAGELGPGDPILTTMVLDDVRAAATATHPLLMGGEYLPELDDDVGEVEIARIELLSVNGDTFSIRARRDGDLIRYRIADEYGNDYDLGASAEPLTLGELITRLDAVDVGYSGLVAEWRIPGCFLENNLQGGAEVEELRGFVTVTSPFYENLEAYYDERADRFLDRWRTEDG